ncbi:hypothetical protein ABPG72_012352 [Tetrahymena utriculariae]
MNNQVVKVHPEQLKTTDPVDQELMNGPINKRECRDILCCLMFIAACVSCIYFFAFGLANGQPDRLFSVYDMAGNPCGLGSQSNRPYLFLYTPYSGYTSHSTCVASCPQSDNDATIDCDTLAMTTGSCSKSSCSQISQLNSNSVCYYQTTLFLKKICFPSASAISSFDPSSASQIQSLINSSTLTNWINDISNAKNVIAGSVGIAFGIGLIYMIFLRFFAGLIVWIAILAYFAGIIILGYLSYKKSTDIKDYLNANNQVESGSNTKDNMNSYLYLSYILWAFAGLCFVGLLCMYTKIRQAIAIIKTTSSYVAEVWTAMLVPPIFTCLVAGWWLMWLVGYVYLYAIDSSGLIQKSNSSMFATVNHSQFVTRLLWSYLFIGLWINAFIQCTCQFILASSACIWYFSHGESGQKHAPIRTSVYRAFRYHLGSIAFGALLLAIVQFIRIVLAYMEQQIKKAGGSNNKLTMCILKCMSCYMACFERFIKFLNKNAFIQIALKGSNFCVAAKNAMEIIWSNAARFALVNGIGGAFIFLGKLFVTCATVFVSYMILTKQSPYKDTIDNFVLPCIIIFFIAYAISICFMCVYGMGMSAILVCFLWDEKMFQKATPPHCPPLLQEFFDKEESKN